MSNIHGFGDYREGQAARRAGQDRYVPVSAAEDGEERIATGISLSAPPENGNIIPSIRERVFPRFKWATFTWFISVVDVVMLITELIVGQVNFGAAFVSGNSMAGPGTETLVYMGGKSTKLIRSGEVWRLFTPILLHAGLLHLIMNLLFQLHFGFTLELRWGLWRFVAVYFLTGVGGDLMSAVCNGAAVSVGASGALFGLLGADITYVAMNWTDIPGNKAEMCTLVFVVIINFLMGSVPNRDGTPSPVDWAAHLGGLLTGIFCASFLTPVLYTGHSTPTWRYVLMALSVVFLGTLSTLLAVGVVHY